MNNIINTMKEISLGLLRLLSLYEELPNYYIATAQNLEEVFFDKMEDTLEYTIDKIEDAFKNSFEDMFDDAFNMFNLNINIENILETDILKNYILKYITKNIFIKNIICIIAYFYIFINIIEYIVLFY